MHNHLLVTRVEAHEALPEVICCRCIISCMEVRSSPYISEVYILDAMQAGHWVISVKLHNDAAGHYTAWTEVFMYRIS